MAMEKVNSLFMKLSNCNINPNSVFRKNHTVASKRAVVKANSWLVEPLPGARNSSSNPT